MKTIKKETQFNVTYLFIAIIAILFIQDFWAKQKSTVYIPYSEFKSNLKQGNIEEITILDKKIQGTFKQEIQNKKKFSTTRVEGDLVRELEASGVKYSRLIENTFFRDLLSWVLPVFLFFGLWIFLMRRIASRQGGMSGGFMSVGKSKAKVYVETDTKITFEDVAGVDEAKVELAEVVNFLKNPDEYGVLGARLPKGILLVGPPGTGKTLLAKAVAGEAAVPFFSISGSEFVEMFVGVGAARVRDLFEQARGQAPCIVFIDELDALGKARSAAMQGGGHDEKEQTLNQLLVELDGFDSKSGIVLLGATNRPEILDPALLRAGRFDRQVLVDRPDKIGRRQILNVHIKKIKIENDLDLDQVAALTPGFTGADLANLVNEAALVATRRKSSNVSLEDFNQAIERIIAGLEKRNRLLNPFEREVVAFHEMGHAIVASCLPGSDPVHKISIIPRGIGALGYTIQRPIEDRFLMKKEELENKMSVLLGGRAAEKIVFDHLSTGASDDIMKATEIARSMVTKYGMEHELGHVNYDNSQASYLGQQGLSTQHYGEQTAQRIDDAVKGLIGEAYSKAISLLEQHRSVLEKSAKELLEKETLNEVDLKRYFAQCKST
jgi:cell division protease FtsH